MFLWRERRPQGSPPLHIIYPRLYYDYNAALQARSLVEAGMRGRWAGTLAVAFLASICLSR